MSAPADVEVALADIGAKLARGTNWSPWWQNQGIRLERRTAILAGRVCGPCSYVDNGWCPCECHGGAR